MPDAVIVSTARTAIGTAFKGSLLDVDALSWAPWPWPRRSAGPASTPELVDDVLLGEILYGGGDIARYAAIEAGLVHAPGVAQNRHCASGPQRRPERGRVHPLRHGPGGRGRRGPLDLDVPAHHAAGCWAPTTGRSGTRPSHRDTPEAPNRDMSITVAGTPRLQADVTREEMDAWALRSHQRAVAAIDAGKFTDEIFPVDVVNRAGDRSVFAVDEHPRRETSMEKLASLKPLHPEIEGFSITVGNVGRSQRRRRGDGAGPTRS